LPANCSISAFHRDTDSRLCEVSGKKTITVTIPDKFAGLQGIAPSPCNILANTISGATSPAFGRPETGPKEPACAKTAAAAANINTSHQAIISP
jgi:hypothetical protein